MALVRSERDKRSAVDVSPLWGGVALASVAVLGLLAPNGLWLLAIIGVIVVTHEAGHLVVARRSGMAPTEFFWGFGPEVIAFDHNGCRYGVKALFLGGYVKLWGMTPTSVLPAGVEESGTYRAASHRGRLATILAGPFVNIVSAIVLFAAAAFIEGGTFVGSVQKGFADVWFVIATTGDALWIWATNIGTYVGSVFDVADGAEPPVRFLSPISQAEITERVVDSGLVSSLRWFAILSCAIGVVNLLPLPPLDGAHALVAAAEKTAQVLGRDRGITLDVRRLEPVAYVTIGALLLLSATALVFDLRDVLVAS